MALDLRYWASLGDKLGWQSQFAGNALTSDCEPRRRGYVDYLIIHHTATTSESGALALMQPGDSRTVSANRVLRTDGKFWRVVSENLRAWTSASWLDDIADTVETVNESGGPTWGISDLSKIALAIWAVEKFRAGRLKAISRQYIIGHSEVLGISGAGYATACPGPDMDLDLIVELAQLIHRGVLGPNLSTPEGADSMRAYKRSNGDVYFADDLGGENVLDYAGGLDAGRAKDAAIALWGPEPVAKPADVYIDYGKQMAERRRGVRARELAALIPAGPGGGGVTIDIAALAKAVNDDAAQRRKAWV